MSEEMGAAEAVVETIVENPEMGGEEIAEVAVEAPILEEGDLSADEEAELEGMIDDAAEDGATMEEVKELIETFKFKANGKDKEITLDWNNKEDIIRRLQLAEAAQPAMQKASEYEKAYDTEQRRLKEDPWAVLKDLGLDPDELAEMRIQDRIDQMKKTPEQIQQEEMAKELAELRAKVKAEKDSKDEADFLRLQHEQEKELETSIIEAISSTTQLSRSPYVVKRIADVMLQAMDKGYKDVTAQQVAPLVEKELRGEIQNMMEQMPDTYMEEFLGKKMMDRLRQNRLKRAKEVKSAKIVETAKPVQKEHREKKRIKMKDFLKRT